MLSFLATRLLNLPGHVSEPEDEEIISVDIDALKALVLPLPNIPWRGVAGICGETITPMYRNIRNMLHEDSEHLAQLFSELEPLYNDSDTDDSEDSKSCVPLPQSARSNNAATVRRINNTLRGDTLMLDRTRHKRTGSLSSPLIIQSTHASIPTIIITPPYVPQPSETFCRVPVQDSSFGNRLTLPAHPAFNEVFPPLIPTAYPLVPVAQSWAWVDGHWQVVLPTLEEQARKGMFSKALVVKRKPCRNLVGLAQ